MNDCTQAATGVSRPARSPESIRSEREEWIHEFRNALGNVLIAAGAAKGLLSEHRDPEVSNAMGHIEDGCDRCLRLLRTMPS